MFEANCSSIEHQYKKLGDGFNKKRGKNKHTCPMFDNKFLASSNKKKLCPIDYIFPIKQEGICDKNLQCFISGGLMLEDIIMNLSLDITEQTTVSVKKDLFS